MKLDYQQIEQDYTKAYGVFKQSKYFRISEPDGYLLFDDRDLYDFFDEQEFYIEVYRGKIYWYFEIYHNEYETADYVDKSTSRTEAEACAFYAAFKLLEETL